MIFRIASLALLAALGGCAMTPQPESPVAEGPANETALLLAEADTAFRDGTPVQLGQVLAELGALGINPLDEAGEQELALWTQKAEMPPAWRGRVLGPGYLTGTLPGRGSRTIEQTFLSGRKAAIAARSPDGDTVGIRVIDRNDEPLCKQVGARVSCQWVPLYTHRHQIEVYNPGRDKLRYFLVIE